MENNKEVLVEAVSEDVAMYLATKESPESVTEVEMLAWQSGYIAGYNRGQGLALDVSEESEEN